MAGLSGRRAVSSDSPLEGTGFEPLVPRRKKKASSGSSTPRVRLGRQGDKGAKPCSLLREPEHNIPAASYSGIACRQALQDYRHIPCRNPRRVAKGPMVRIHLPPAESPQTIGSSAAERDCRSAHDEPALRRRIRKPCGSRAVEGRPLLLLCRFSDAGMTGPRRARGGRRLKSAKARNRGRWGAVGGFALSGGFGRFGQAAAAGNLTKGSSLNGAMVSSVM